MSLLFQITGEEMKERMKKIGISPMKSYMEKPTYISSTGVIMDQYVPVEGDGKASLISLTGTKQVKTCIFIRLSFFMFSLQLFNFTKNSAKYYFR